MINGGRSSLQSIHFQPKTIQARELQLQDILNELKIELKFNYKS